MNTTLLASFGAISAILNLAAFIPYIRSIKQGRTKPERSTWWIWSVLMIVAFVAQAAEGATWSLLLTVTLFAGNITIALLSLRHGYGRFKPKDITALFIALVGIGLWKLTNNPLVALLIIIGVDYVGNWLTFEKSWRAPYSENLPAWILMGCAGIASALSVGNWRFALIIFPLYMVVVNMMTAGAIIYRRRWRKTRAADGRRLAKEGTI